MKPEIRTTTEELYTHAHAAAAVAIRGKHSQSGNKKLTALQNTATADKKTQSTAERITEAGELIAKAAELREAAKYQRATANQSGRTLAEKRLASAEAERMTKAAEAMERNAAAIETGALEDSTITAPGQNNSRTFSEYMPIVHDAIVGHMTAEQMPYIVTPNDMDKAAESVRKAVEAHQSASPDTIYNAAHSALAIIQNCPEYLFETAYNNAIFRAATNAANRAITANLHHDSHTRTTERKTLATPEIMEAWRATHGNNSGKAYKVYVGREEADYYTMEYRQYKTEPSGFYLVYHHKTVAPMVSIEAWAENSHRAEAEAAEHGPEALDTARAEAEAVDPAIITNGGLPMVETQEARERIEAAMEAANLTARERDFLAYFLSPKAAHAGQEAVNAAEAAKVRARRAEAEAKEAERTAKRLAAKPNQTDKEQKRTAEAQAAAEEARKAAKAARAEAAQIPNDTELTRYQGMRHAAAAHIGIQTDTAERKFMERLRARIKAAVGIEQGCTTPEEAEAAEAKAWEQMQKNSRRNSGRAAETVTVVWWAIDTPKAIEAAAAEIQRRANRKNATEADKARAARAMEVCKTTSTHKADTVTAWKTPGEAWRATIEARATGEATRRTRTAYAAHNAAAAALVFLATITAREAESIAAALRAEAVTTPDTLTAAVLEHEAQRATAPKGHAPKPTAREAREAKARAARLAEMEAFTALIEAEDKRRAATKTRPTYTAEEVEAMRARAKANAAKHNAIMEAARATEPSRTR